MIKKYISLQIFISIDAFMPSMEREKLIVQWLSEIEDNAEEIYLLGDIFDYWFDYKEVVPKGYTLLLGKLKYLRIKGIPIYFSQGIMICGCLTILKMNWKYLLTEALWLRL